MANAQNRKKKYVTWKGFAVYSCWGFHAFYQTEEVARKHWKNYKRYGLCYEIYPVTLKVLISKTK
jgi:hypothetical protein